MMVSAAAALAAPSPGRGAAPAPARRAASAATTATATATASDDFLPALASADGGGGRCGGCEEGPLDDVLARVSDLLVRVNGVLSSASKGGGGAG